MKWLCILLSMAACAAAQDLTANVVPASGPETTLAASYAYPDTQVGATQSVVVRVRNGTSYPVEIVALLVSDSPGGHSTNANFTVTGQVTNKILAPNSNSSFEDVTVSFSPLSQGPQTGYLEAVYAVQQNGCSFVSQSNACASTTASLSSMSGLATAAALTLSYTYNGTTATPQANSSSPVDFGNVSTSGSQAATFTLTNNSGSAISAPAVALQAAVFGSSAFALDVSSLPASIAAGASATFRVTFAPGQTGLTTAALTVGTASYTLNGTGIAVTLTDALQISYTDTTGVRISPQSATAIAFDQLTAGAGKTSVLTFVVANPSTSFSGIAVSTVTASGAGFAIANAPTFPATIAPGQSISFQVVFSGSTTGTYAGALVVDTRQFALSGKVIASPLPDATLSFDQNPTTSQQQVHVSVKLASASSVSSIGQLSATFRPAVSGINDDPAIYFLATSGRSLQVSVAEGDTSASYDGQSSLTFQTGTTAGTLTFTLAFPNKAPVTQSFTITPVAPAVASITAVRQDPYLVVTATGFDNSYSASQMAFTFYDGSGALINSSPLTADVTSAFHNYFFGTTNKAGGAFVVQAKFPVTGSVNQIGSIKVNLSNTAGTSTSTATFQ